MTKTDISAETGQWSKDLELRIKTALKGIRFGAVGLVIQDGRVIQIDKSEKIRLA